MTIFGIVISTTLLIVAGGIACLWAGSKFSAWLKALPLVGRLF